MKTNLRLLLERRKTPPHIWCYNNRIGSAEDLAKFLKQNNMFVDRPLEEWMHFSRTNQPVEEMEILATAEPPLPEPTEQEVVNEEPEQPLPEKLSKRTSKPKRNLDSE
jgi:hypothetical protein